MYDRLCLFGAGGHGRVVASQIRARLPRTILAFGDSYKLAGSFVGEIPVTATSPGMVQDAYMIVTIGDNYQRNRTQQIAARAGVRMAHFIADEDRFFARTPGSGSVILAGAIVTRDARIGNGVIINSGAIVEHDCDIGDFCHLAPGSVLAGGTILGENVFVGAGARIVNQARIAANTVIGAGAIVIKNISQPGTYAGVPARCIDRKPAQ